MKALVLRAPEKLEVMDVPRPKLSSGQVLIRVHRCGICGSDIRYFHGENPWAKQTLGQEAPNPPNIILGHEFVGTVVEAFDPDNANLVGKRVGVNTFLTCGRCAYCRSGKENLCDFTKHLGHGQGWGQMEFYPGGMAEFCPAFASQVYELPASVTDDQATFFDPLIAALHATEVGRPTLLDTVAILGAGPIGLLIAQFSRLYGARQTFITDIARENIEAARKIGVDFPLNLHDSKASLHDLVMEKTSRQGVNIVFNTVGSNDSIIASLKILKKGGMLVLMANKEEELRIPALLLSGERAIRTSSNAMYTDFPRVIELVAQNAILVDPLISHRFPLSKALEAFSVACNKEKTGAIKIILDCQS